MYVDTDNIQMTKNKTIWWKNEQSFILQVMYKNTKHDLQSNINDNCIP